MKKENNVFTFSATNFAVDNSGDTNIARFDVVASQSGVLTSHGIQFKKGAFSNAISKLGKRRKMLPMFFNHDNNMILGGFPVSKITEDGSKLRMRAEMNLGVEKSREVLSLIRQGVLTDLSVGVQIEPKNMKYQEDAKIMMVNEVADLFETSIVWSGSNSKAVITNFSVQPYQGLAFADFDYTFDSQQAIERVKQFTDSIDKPSKQYKDAFLWCDVSNPQCFDSYKMLFVDIIDGKMRIIPQALDLAVQLIKNGNMQLSENETDKLQRNINKYSVSMGKAPVFDIKPISEYSIGDCELFLIKNGLSVTEARCFLSKKADRMPDATISKKAHQFTDDELTKLVDIKNQFKLEIKKWQSKPQPKQIQLK